MLLKNQTISRDGKNWRVIHIEAGTAYLFPLDSKGVKLTEVSYEKLNSEYDSKLITDFPDPYGTLRFKKAEGKTEQKALFNYELLKPIVENTSALVDSRQRKRIMLEVSASKGVAVPTLYRLINSWFKKGQIPNALIPEYGHNTKDRITKTKTGPVSKTCALVPPADEEVRSEFDKAIKKYLLRPNPLSVRKAYLAFLGDYRCKHPDKAEETLPTIYQFKHCYNRKYPRAERRRKQVDSITFSKDVRALTGSTFDISQSIGDIWEIDSTIADVHLVSSKDRTQPVGRPVIYSVVDVYSGMIVGLDVGLESAQYKTAADALYNAMTDKVSFCKSNNVEIKPQEWPCSGVPRCIVADNAELAGSQIENFARFHGTVISTTPSYRGDCKGTVESSLGQMQSELKGFLTGEPDKRVLKKAGAKDGRLEATLTIDEYKSLVIRAALISNHRLREKTPKGFPANTAPTPMELWKRALRFGRVELSMTTDAEKLRISLLPHKDATVSRKGFNIDGIRYICTDAIELGYLDRGDTSELPNIKVAIDPNCVDTAWAIPDPDDLGKIWTCSLAPASAHLSSMSWEQAKEYLKEASEARQKARQDSDRYAALQLKEQRKIIEKSKEEKPKTDKSKAQRLSSIKESRKQEKIRLQQENPRLPSSAKEKREVAKPEADKSSRNKYAYPSSIEDIAD